MATHPPYRPILCCWCDEEATRILPDGDDCCDAHFRMYAPPAEPQPLSCRILSAMAAALRACQDDDDPSTLPVELESSFWGLIEEMDESGETYARLVAELIENQEG